MMLPDKEIEELVLKTVNRVAGRHSIVEREELKSVGYEAYMTAMQTFDKNKGTNFKTWVFAKVYWAIKDAIRNERIRIKIELRHSLEPSFKRHHENITTNQELVNFLLSTVTDETDLKILNLSYYDGLTAQQISKRVSLHSSQVYRRRKRVLEQLGKLIKQ